MWAALRLQDDVQLEEAVAFQRIVDGGDADEELTEHEVPTPDLPVLAPTVDYVEFAKWLGADAAGALFIELSHQIEAR